jgi:hypothetical protein
MLEVREEEYRPYPVAVHVENIVPIIGITTAAISAILAPALGNPSHLENPSNSSAAIEPSDGAFHNPAFGNNLEADRGIGTLDDFNVERGEDFQHSVGELWSLIAAVGEQLLQERERAKQRRQDEHAAIAIGTSAG